MMMPSIYIYRVNSRAARFCLHFEWFMLPMGAGAIGPALMFCMAHWGDSGFMAWFPKLWGVLPILALIIGIWRPMHRRLGFKRNTMWTP